MELIFLLHGWIFLGTKHEIGEGNEMYQFRNLGEAGGM